MGWSGVTAWSVVSTALGRGDDVVLSLWETWTLRKKDFMAESMKAKAERKRDRIRVNAIASRKSYIDSELGMAGNHYTSGIDGKVMIYHFVRLCRGWQQ